MKKLLLILLATVLMLPLYIQSAVAGDIGQINQAMVETYGEEFKNLFPEFVDIKSLKK